MEKINTWINQIIEENELVNPKVSQNHLNQETVVKVTGISGHTGKILRKQKTFSSNRILKDNN